MEDHLAACVNRMNSVVNSMSEMSTILAGSTADLGRQARVLGMKQQAILVSENDVNVAKLARNEARLSDLARLSASTNRQLDVLATEKRELEEERRKYLDSVELAVQTRLEAAEKAHEVKMVDLAAKKASLSSEMAQIEKTVAEKEAERAKIEGKLKDSRQPAPEGLAVEDKRRLVGVASARVSELNEQIKSLEMALEQRKAEIEELQSGKADKRKRKANDMDGDGEGVPEKSQEEIEITSAIERLRKQVALLENELSTRFPNDVEALKMIMLNDAKTELSALQERQAAITEAELPEKKAKVTGAYAQLSVLIRNFAPNQRAGTAMARVLQIVLEHKAKASSKSVSRDDLHKLFPVTDAAIGNNVDSAVDSLKSLGLLKVDRHNNISLLIK